MLLALPGGPAPMPVSLGTMIPFFEDAFGGGSPLSDDIPALPAVRGD